MNREYNSNTGMCDCLSGYVDNGSAICTLDCHYSCETCTGPSVSECD